MAHGIGKLTGRSQPWKERKKERSVFNEGVIIQKKQAEVLINLSNAAREEAVAVWLDVRTFARNFFAVKAINGNDRFG